MFLDCHALSRARKDGKSVVTMERLVPLTKDFKNDFGLTPVIGVELEFYLTDQSLLERVKNFINPTNTIIVAETGYGQFEFIFQATSDLATYLEYIHNLKSRLCAELGSRILFSSKPFAVEPSSGLHVHLNFLDRNENNIFDVDDKYLDYVAGGLLKDLKKSLKVFAPHEEDLVRYSAHSMHSPSTVSWGVENRTTALRITARGSGIKRIEHRAPCASADIYEVVRVILESAYFGLMHKVLPPDKTYGNAFDKQYNLETLT